MDFEKVSEGMTLMHIGQMMEQIADTLNLLGDKASDPERKAAYHGASLYVLRGTLEIMKDGMDKIREGKEA